MAKELKKSLHSIKENGDMNHLNIQYFKLNAQKKYEPAKYEVTI